MELVEAEQPGLGRDALGQGLQRLALAARLAQAVQALVHVDHEGVEVDPALLLDPHRAMEEIHEHRLAAPDAAVEVDALGAEHDLRHPPEQPAEQATLWLGSQHRLLLECPRQPVEALGRGALQGVEGDVACFDQGLKAFEGHELVLEPSSFAGKQNHVAGKDGKPSKPRSSDAATWHSDIDVAEHDASSLRTSSDCRLAAFVQQEERTKKGTDHRTRQFVVTTPAAPRERSLYGHVLAGAARRCTGCGDSPARPRRSVARQPSTARVVLIEIANWPSLPSISAD